MTTTVLNPVLARWNELDVIGAAREIIPCCGSHAWAKGLAERRPFADVKELLQESDEVWQKLSASDWCEALDSHPRIGQRRAQAATARSLAWSAEEQCGVATGGSGKAALADVNREYEARFGRIFIVCASGRSTAEILAIAQRRMQNNVAEEMIEAAEQQRQITQLRLQRWLEVS